MVVIKSIVMVIVYIYTKDKSRLITASLSRIISSQVLIKEMNNVILVHALISFNLFFILEN